MLALIALAITLSVAGINLIATLSGNPHQQRIELSKGHLPQTSNCDVSPKRSITFQPDSLSKSAVKKVEPVFPEAARHQGVEGLVIVKVLVNTRGKVERACAVEGDEILKPAAEAAALEWKFSEFSVTYKKVDFVVSWIPFHFVLSKETPESLAQKLKKFGEIDFSQAEYGLIAEIREKRRVFIYTENPTTRDQLYSVLHRNLEIVAEPDEADYFVSYATWQVGRLPNLPPPFDPSMSGSPIFVEDFIIFSVKDRTEQRVRPRVLLWRDKKAAKLPRPIKFDRTPAFSTLIALLKAFSEVYQEE